METNELHRGRLIDHIQLVVRDLEASRTFYRAVFDVPEIRTSSMPVSVCRRRSGHPSAFGVSGKAASSVG